MKIFFFHRLIDKWTMKRRKNKQLIEQILFFWVQWKYQYRKTDRDQAFFARCRGEFFIVWCYTAGSVALNATIKNMCKIFWYCFLNCKRLHAFNEYEVSEWKCIWLRSVWVCACACACVYSFQTKIVCLCGFFFFRAIYNAIIFYAPISFVQSIVKSCSFVIDINSNGFHVSTDYLFPGFGVTILLLASFFCRCSLYCIKFSYFHSICSLTAFCVRRVMLIVMKLLMRKRTHNRGAHIYFIGHIFSIYFTFFGVCFVLHWYEIKDKGSR